MNEKLQNIFVSLEVAKMANQKGFDDLCAAVSRNIDDIDMVLPNLYFGKHDGIYFETENYDVFFKVDFLGIPTHYQLIKWLLDNHQIDVWYGFSEWSVYRSGDQSAIGYAESINEALLLALNQLPDKL